MSYKKIKPNKIADPLAVAGRPAHCDVRILHAPGECTYCDENPSWQALRQLWGIAFTGYEPEDKELPCPADYARGDTHTKWFGNLAQK